MHLIRTILFLFCFQAFFVNVQAQSPFVSPYTLTYKLDVPVATAGLGLNFAYFLMNRKTEVLTEPYILALDRSDIPRIDRPAAYNWSGRAALGSDILMFSGIAAPSFLFLDRNIRKDWLKIGTIWAETMALNTGITNLTKVLVKRTRPYVYNPNAPAHYKTEKDAQYSFFSGHTSVTASMTFMSAKIYSDYNQGSKALPYVWAAAAIVPAATAFLRWRAGKHFFSDVLVGYITGAAIGFIVPHLHKVIR
jgi:membrane-associated phospholipid phosphatase